MVARINEIRRERDLQPLEPTGALADVARRYSCRMAREAFFAHRSPTGDTVADRLRRADLSYRLLGENLARNTNARQLAKRAVEGWMESEQHRQNIVRAGFTQTGVGICRRPITQRCGQRIAGAPEASPRSAVSGRDLPGRGRSGASVTPVASRTGSVSLSLGAGVTETMQEDGHG